MELVVLKNNLLEGLSALEKAVGANTNLPILKGVLIEAENNKIAVTATNLELAVKAFISGKVIENGKAVVPFSLFEAIIRNIPSERIDFKKKDKNLSVSTDNYEAQIHGQDPKEFPIIPAVHNKELSLKMNSRKFHDALESVIVATQYSEVRPEISGVSFRYEEETLTFAATDSFRLAERKVDSREVSSTFDAAAIIIPLRTAEELLRVVGAEEGEVEVFIDSNQALVRTASKEIMSRLIDGKFPEYQSIIPKQAGSEITVNRQELTNALKLTGSFSGRGNDVTLKVGDNKKFLELYSASSFVGENHYRIPIKMKGDRFSIVFNWRYLLDGLKIWKSEEVILNVAAHDKPAKVSSLTEPNLFYVLMPIKV